MQSIVSLSKAVNSNIHVTCTTTSWNKTNTTWSSIFEMERKTNAYARYFLMMYWPEPLKKQDVPLEYTWDAFEEWINEECESNTAFGICHLMMMHRHMQTTYTDNQM